MNKSLFKLNKLLMIMFNSMIKLPTPININYWWNFGSILGITLMNQIISGLFLTMHYNSNINLAFFSIIHIIQNINNGWLIRLMHMNGASLFFLMMYCHIGRGIYYHSFKLIKPWMVGSLMFMLSMATAFMGYVLPWGQMSFWGATVITNLISTIPMIGQMMVEWIWGGFSIEAPTLSRFYSFHFIFPLIITLLVMIHLMYLHETGSNNPLGLNSNLSKINFNPYFMIKDFLGFSLTFMIFMNLILLNPYILSDPENFIWANPMMTPIHIQPEWYFLFAYTILRSIPNKTGGVIALLMSIMILMFLPLMYNLSFTKSFMFYPLNQLFFWLFLNIMILLTWLGSQLIMYPFTLISQILTFLYFSYYPMNSIIMILWNKLILKL